MKKSLLRLIHYPSPSSSLLVYPPKAVRSKASVLRHLNSLAFTAAQHGLSSLTSVQTGCQHQCIVMHQGVEKAGCWQNQSFKTGKFNKFIKPKIVNASDKLVQSKQLCPCLPFLQNTAVRASDIQVQFNDQDFNLKRVHFKGFEALVFQHQLDHLRGRLNIAWDVHWGNLYIKADECKFFEKSKEVADEFNSQVRDKMRKFPELKKRDLQWYNNSHSQKQSLLQFQQDFYDRFRKHFGKELEVHFARLQEGLQIQ